MSIKSFPDYKKTTWIQTYFLSLLKLVSKILYHVFIVTHVTFGFWMQHFQTGGLGEMVLHRDHHDRQISSPLVSFYGGMLRTSIFYTISGYYKFEGKNNRRFCYNK